VKSLPAVLVFSFGIGSFAQQPPAQQQPPETCSAKQEAGYMVSWAGQPGEKDHSEIRSLTKGTRLWCLSFAADGSSPACNVSMENGGHFTLPSQNAIRIPHDDTVTLTCKGKNPTCCKVQMTPDSTPLKKSDTKPQPEPQLGIVGEQQVVQPNSSI